MKRILLLLTLLGFIVTGCNRSNDEPVIETYLSVDREDITISPEGGSVDITLYCNKSWSIEGDSVWCTPSVVAGEANESGTKVTFWADMTYDTREAQFEVVSVDKRVTLVVRQAQKDNIEIAGQQTFELSSEGGVVNIECNTNVDYEVIIPTHAQSWIWLSDSRGMTRESIMLDVAENTTYDARTAVVRVVAVGDENISLEYNIIQAQRDAILISEENLYNMPFTAGELTLGYQSNVECDVVVLDQTNSWITIASNTRGLVDNLVVVNILENTISKERSCVVRIVAVEDDTLYAEYTINQMPAPERVDLGLSVRWSNFNVGANYPEDYGDYYAWGEIEPKSEYSLHTYRYWSDLNGNDYAYGADDVQEWVSLGSSISENPLYDAATANWGGGWRMPTKAEIEELCNLCTWEHVALNGVEGMRVTGINGNSIFLPFAGCRSGVSLKNGGSLGHYWCSTPDNDAVHCVDYLYFGSGYYECSWDTRFYGHSIRPVAK